MSASLSSILGGQPSITTPTPPPCDSPQVVMRKSCPKLLPIRAILAAGSENHNDSKLPLKILHDAPHCASMRAILALEDGRIFEGESFGATGTRIGEVCFNTSMTGYQEVLTDPSYRGQIVAMTYPLIGNYGTNALDQESRSPHVRGFVIEELSEIPSNWRSTQSLDA